MIPIWTHSFPTPGSSDIVGYDGGTLAEEVARRPPPEAVVPPLQPQPTQYELMAHSGQEDAGDSAGSDPWPFGPPATPLREGNGFGAFSADGHEYVIALEPGPATPAPWRSEEHTSALQSTIRIQVAVLR